MNTHKHARLTFARRLQMVGEMTEGGLSANEPSAGHGVTPRTDRKGWGTIWLVAYLPWPMRPHDPCAHPDPSIHRSIDPA